MHRVRIDVIPPHLLSAADVASHLAGVQVHHVHRLDMETSGVLLFAKNERTSAALDVQFREHGVEKVYVARILGTPTLAHTLAHTLAPHNDAHNDADNTTHTTHTTCTHGGASHWLPHPAPLPLSPAGSSTQLRTPRLCPPHPLHAAGQGPPPLCVCLCQVPCPCIVWRFLPALCRRRRARPHTPHTHTHRGGRKHPPALLPDPAPAAVCLHLPRSAWGRIRHTGHTAEPLPLPRCRHRHWHCWH
mmetsp:Transcript_24605/g.54698  ORF Transcript_24605/g.54698 Transcript_24605/m.54698 type:complete len:245 (+) Transcript_24605:119-853(+)